MTAWVNERKFNFTMNKFNGHVIETKLWILIFSWAGDSWFDPLLYCCCPQIHRIIRKNSWYTTVYCVASILEYSYSINYITQSTLYYKLGIGLQVFARQYATENVLSTCNVGEAKLWYLVGELLYMHFSQYSQFVMGL
jgi:hypothetical protein